MRNLIPSADDMSAFLARTGFQLQEETRRVLLPFPREETPYAQPGYPYGKYRCIRLCWIEPGQRGGEIHQLRHYFKTSHPRWNVRYTPLYQQSQQEAAAFVREELRNYLVPFNQAKHSTYHHFAWFETITAQKIVSEVKTTSVEFIQPNALSLYDGPLAWRRLCQLLCRTTGLETGREARMKLLPPFDHRLVQAEQAARQSSPSEWTNYLPMFY